MRVLPLSLLALVLLAEASAAAGIPLPDSRALLKTIKADVATSSALPPWHGPKWEYFAAPMAKLDSNALANPVTAAAALLANTVIDDGVRLGATVVSFSTMGEHGWELIAIQGGRAYFKRPRLPVLPSATASLTPVATP